MARSLANVAKEHDLSSEEHLLQSTLENVFHYDAFKPLQKEIISATVAGKNVLGVLGTGGGKTLTFMLPAILSDKPTIVVVPTLSLIEDLLSSCFALDIKACKITGDVPSDIRNTCLNQLPSYKILFFTPEMFACDNILDKIKNVSLERIVFDEAHTICSWGSTFRPQYKSAAKELVKLPYPKLLLSATIPNQMVLELSELFGNFQVIKGTVLRDNISLNVEERPTGRKFYDQLAGFILKKPDDCGIIYAVFPSDVSKIHSELVKRNVNCAKYHGQLSQIVKDSSYHRWYSGDVNVMIANTSFGMGIDKKDVRFIIHARVPTNIDEYFQQCGRAGRDGLESVCMLYYTYTDKTALLKLFSSGENFTTQSRKLNALIDYLEDPVSCRHLSILRYYGEDRVDYVCGDHCDNCKHRGTYIKIDGTSDALTVVQAMLELSTKKVSCQTLKLFLVGSSQKCIKDNELDSLSTFGCMKGKFIPSTLLDKFLHILINNDVLYENTVVKSSSFSVLLNPGPKAHLVLSLSMFIEKYCKV